MKKDENKEDLLSAGRSGYTGETLSLLHTDAKLRSTNDSGHIVLPVRNKRIKMLCIAAAFVLLGLMAACDTISDSPEKPGPQEEPGPQENADLIDLTISPGSLSPGFTANTTAYSAFIDSVTGSITVTPTTSDPNAMIEVRVDGGSWMEVLSGIASSSLAMDLGANSVEVRVTAEDGTTTKTYTIDVDRGILVPDEFATIQAAIDATVDGDMVLVREGTYVENIVFPTDRSITVRSTHGPESTIIDGSGNALSVVTFSTSVESMVLDGFTITNGNTTGVNGEGGGIYILENSPMITNCIISGNTTEISHGGGIYCNNASPTITNCTISENSVSSYVIGWGGGMYNYLSSPILTNCTFEGNFASSGGGMYNSASTPTMTDCTFSVNSAYGLGGGMYNSVSSPTVTGCTFSENTITVGSYGGGMYNFDSSPKVVNCIFYNNYGNSNGWDMVNEGNSASPTVTNCTFRNYKWSMYNITSSPTVTNCIFWGGGINPMIVNNNATPVFTYSAFQYKAWEDIIVQTGTGNIDIFDDSPFVNHAGGDLHLQPSSPCIDAGDNSAPDLPAVDIDGDDRRIDDPTVTDTGNGTAPIVDMGADEFVGL